MVEKPSFGGITLLSAITQNAEHGVETINIVNADNKFFLHKQIQRKCGMTFMRMKKRRLY